MTIAEVSDKFDLPADTLRYHERIGLIQKITRASGGQRDYGEEDLRRVEFSLCTHNADVSIETLVE